MANATDTLFAQFALLEYLRASHHPRTVREILSHLQHNTSWGQTQLDKKLRDGGLRNVQNWLKDLRESAEFGQQIEWEEDPSNRKQYRYRSRQSGVDTKNMGIEEASLLLLAEKFLDVALPADFYDASLQDLFFQARDAVKKYEKRPVQARRAVTAYLSRIAIAQRGQQLIQQSVPYAVLGLISKAILDRRCLKVKYNGKGRLLHPYGLVSKEPKIYLVAVEDHVLKTKVLIR